MTIVDYIGALEYGRCYCFIKCDSNWFKFKDIMVEITEKLEMKIVTLIIYYINRKIINFSKHFF